MIRCLLTAVTSVQCGDLHGQSLIAAIHAVLRMYAGDRDPQNQRTAQAALTQMVNVVVRRLEQTAAPRHVEVTQAKGHQGDFSNSASLESESSHASHSRCAEGSLDMRAHELNLEKYVDSRLCRIIDEISSEIDLEEAPGNSEETEPITHSRRLLVHMYSAVGLSLHIRYLWLMHRLSKSGV